MAQHFGVRTSRSLVRPPQGSSPKGASSPTEERVFCSSPPLRYGSWPRASFPPNLWSGLLTWVWLARRVASFSAHLLPAAHHTRLHHFWHVVPASASLFVPCGPPQQRSCAGRLRTGLVLRRCSSVVSRASPLAPPRRQAGEHPGMPQRSLSAAQQQRNNPGSAVSATFRIARSLRLPCSCHF
ncbi:hypothetical protein NDU88_005087 [Pleurodeles waltl]|uniref:Uncharacterized protein n=1 Tax=Pleurodeles waltl TaxID=8319 RepID=A0AAV7WYH8_PLEWA|nr:hypothetical protein NDU88_005087 [Pleurodeles waltl]